MSRFNNNYKKFKSSKVKQILSNSLFGTFCIIGLSGCNDIPDECKDLSILPQRKIDECMNKKSNYSSSYVGGSSHNSFFSPIFGGSSYSDSNSTNNSNKSSGFFSSSKSSGSSFSSHSSSFGG